MHSLTSDQDGWWPESKLTVIQVLLFRDHLADKVKKIYTDVIDVPQLSQHCSQFRSWELLSTSSTGLLEDFAMSASMQWLVFISKGTKNSSRASILSDLSVAPARLRWTLGLGPEGQSSSNSQLLNPFSWAPEWFETLWTKCIEAGETNLGSLWAVSSPWVSL